MHLNISAPINFSGYGIMSKSLIKGLASINQSMTVFPDGKCQFETAEEAALISQYIVKDTFDNNAVSLRIGYPDNLYAHTTNKRIGMTVFEGDKLSTKDLSSIKSNDHIVVPSKWAKSVLEGYGVTNVSVVPLGIDTSIFNNKIEPSPSNYYRKRGNTFVALCIGKLEKRKGILESVLAFNKAFSFKDDVELWLSCYNPYMPESEYARMLETITSSKVNPLWSKTVILPRVETQKDLADIMCQADCGLFMSHAEGWNLPLLETMATGTPCIATNYSAHTEYINSDNCFLVDIDSLEPANDGLWFKGESNWACIGDDQIATAATYLNRMYAGLYSDKQKAVIDNSIQTGSCHNLEKYASDMVNAIKAI